jgi:hypothetical protein
MPPFKAGTYRHFKGDSVEALFLAHDSELPDEFFVVYEHGGKKWIRPYKMFFENVQREGYSGPRFQFIG